MSSAAEDYRRTNELKKRRPEAADKQLKMRYVFMLCPKCGYSCTVGTWDTGRIKKHCSRCCTGIMQEQTKNDRPNTTSKRSSQMN